MVTIEEPNRPITEMSLSEEAPETIDTFSSPNVLVGLTHAVYTPPSFILELMINNAEYKGFVRDDSLNDIIIQFKEKTLVDLKPEYRECFLYQDEIIPKLTAFINSELFKENVLYIYFAMKPSIGEFRNDLITADLFEVASINSDSDAIFIKASFKKKLRPYHSLQQEYRKRKKNSINLTALLIYSFNSKIKATEISSSFTFRSNSGQFKVNNNIIGDDEGYISNKRKKKKIIVMIFSLLLLFQNLR